jgi:hypothetical protein
MNHENTRSLHPYCMRCGWRKGGADSWNGRACKCGHSEPVIQMIDAADFAARVPQTELGK